MGLYCDNRYMRMMLQSIFSIGSIIGTIYIPMLNDLKGRKFSFYVTLLTTLIGDIGLLIGILNKMYYLICFSQILSALGSNAILPLSYSIGSEFFSDSLRQKSVIYYCLAWYLFVYLGDWHIY
jgi:MFS family permease